MGIKIDCRMMSDVACDCGDNGYVSYIFFYKNMKLGLKTSKENFVNQNKLFNFCELSL